MKNLLTKSLLLILPFLLFSCNEEDDNVTTNQPFFNINVGNKWVYKTYYNSYDSPNQFTFSGIVDTVKIIGTENIQGFTFVKKYSKKTNINDGSFVSETYSYLRINNLGHLVEISDINNYSTISETTGVVLHPGFDKNFTYSRVFSLPNGAYNAQEVFGDILFSVFNPLNISVEGNNYLVSPYKGVFTPSANHPELVSKTTEYNYSKNIGLLKAVEHSLFTYNAW